MESLEELTKSTNGKPGFFKHVFNFNDDSKNDMLNIVQYAAIALVPVVIMNKVMQRFVPEADDTKGNIEILAEIIGQVFVMFIGILIIHRIITFIPTYSGSKYANFDVTSIILAMLTIILSLQTKLGEKVSIIVDRIMELWEGPKDTKKKKKGQGNVKVSQPISQGQSAVVSVPMMTSPGTTSINSLPMQQSQPDFNNMYQQDNTPLVNAATPGEGFENGGGIMAANEALGGSGFSSW
jgi:hypothetical protein